MPTALADRFPDQESQDELTWKPLRLLTFYRVILAGLLTMLFFSISDSTILGIKNPVLYALTCSGYLGFGLLAGFTTRLRRPGYELQTVVQLLTDIAAISLLIHASGGTSSGLDILLIITVAAGSILLPGRMAYLFAAVAAMAIMGEQIYRSLILGIPETTDYTATGMLGLALFSTAVLTNLLVHRIHESEALAQRRGIDIANLAKLNAHIVQRLQAGIIVTDHERRIRLINETARSLLDLTTDGEGQPLESVSPPLYEKLMDWHKAPDREPTLLNIDGGNKNILPRFTLLGTAKGIGALIFLEDTAAMAKQAQQIKLASLGRLTASIAHEIRNPLGAISHAKQLLDESASLDDGDRRLISIIGDHTRRVNTVVENVLQLSRPVASLSQQIKLAQWLEKFVDEFTHSGHCQPEQISFVVAPDDIEVYMDPSLLHQVVWNLCQNGINHGAQEGKAVQIRLSGGLSATSRTVHLDIMDNGPGIEPDMTDTIFEPFFTTNSSGTGLGLYIAREICESHQAHLDYLPAAGGGSCFRITFPNTETLPASAFA
jgi:two-component system sensor histidine kinase PilS (NtrC family)